MFGLPVFPLIDSVVDLVLASPSLGSLAPMPSLLCFADRHVVVVVVAAVFGYCSLQLKHIFGSLLLVQVVSA